MFEFIVWRVSDRQPTPLLLLEQIDRCVIVAASWRAQVLKYAQVKMLHDGQRSE